MVKNINKYALGSLSFMMVLSFITYLLISKDNENEVASKSSFEQEIVLNNAPAKNSLKPARLVKAENHNLQDVIENISVLGTMANEEKPGFGAAVIQIPGNHSSIYNNGDMLYDGIILDSIHKFYVIIKVGEELIKVSLNTSLSDNNADLNYDSQHQYIQNSDDLSASTESIEKRQLQNHFSETMTQPVIVDESGGEEVVNRSDTVFDQRTAGNQDEEISIYDSSQI